MNPGATRVCGPEWSWSFMRKRKGGRQSLSVSEDKISDSNGAELAERKEND